ncbi:putative cellular morphogenesis regulator [Erysiphe necator]|uniref:Putative cellular morphogenesis regulator n=1 Tax=Uncinula necator TaxID=52586 RepID=A0A0B1P3K0_UNCNE|nr:putative cellular morphogenesis regulator [Erysiphe necator]
MASERSVTPEPSSGRASPVVKTWSSQLSVEEVPLKDKAFRRYASSVDRSLSLFESALQEWADYISFLSKLLKSLQARPPHSNEIPHKVTVAKRLAQCLNPSLPSGVHQKVLEVYRFIFSIIGKDKLSRDLYIYLPGLVSTLSFASLSVRALFIELIEDFFLKVDPQSLRPAIKALILALLPGLEDETSEDFERTLHLIDNFKNVIRPANSEDLMNGHSSGDGFFWQCFFLASITSSNRRGGALAYLIRNLPKLGQSLPPISPSLGTTTLNIEQGASSHRFSEILTSPEPGLLLRCFAAGLNDEQLLTQRGFLDLLVTHLPLHSTVLQKKVKSEDLELLVTAAAGVVSRRDMSLNRRLWTWFLGPSVDIDNGIALGEQLQQSISKTQYFEKFGLHPLTQALLRLIEHNSDSPLERARPFKICLSLMDKWEIGGLLVTEIFLPIVHSVYKYKTQAATKTEFSEVLRSASVFFDGVEGGLIWSEIMKLITQAISPGKFSYLQRHEKLSLANFIITQFNVREEEMLMVHAPLTVLAILLILEDSREAPHIDLLDPKTFEELSNLALELAIDLVEFIPERALQNQPSTVHEKSMTHERPSHENILEANILQNIKDFYIQEQGNLDASPPPFTSIRVTELLLQKAAAFTTYKLSTLSSAHEVSNIAWLLVNLLSKATQVESFDTSKLLSAMTNRLSASSHLPFLVFTSINYLATSLHSSSYISMEDLSGLVELLVRRAWLYMSASYPKYHVEAVRSLWQLQAALSSSNRDIEAAICSIMIENGLNDSQNARYTEFGRTFSVLWTHTLYDNPTNVDRRSSKVSRLENKSEIRFSSADHFELILSRPLFLLLDALSDESTQLFMTVRMWLQNLTNTHKLFHIFVTKLSQFDFLQNIPIDLSGVSNDQRLIHRGDYDLDQCLYYLRTLSNVLRWASESTWATLALNNIPSEIVITMKLAEKDSETTILGFFLDICLKVIRITYDPDNIFLQPQVSHLHRTSLNLLHQILLCPYTLSLADLRLEKILMERLMQSLDEPDPFVQVLLLDVVFATLKLLNKPRHEPPLSSMLSIKRSFTSVQKTSSNSQPSIISENTDSIESSHPNLPPILIKCIQAGLSAASSRPVLDSWISFLTECLQFYNEDIFQILIPLVETLCSQINDTFSSLQNIFRKNAQDTIKTYAPESTLISLLNGLENVLERGHHLLLQDESRTPNIKSPDQPQGFFGNIVSGVFASDVPQSRSATANNRLTVLLTFQDAVKICYIIWSWGGDEFSAQDSNSTSSFKYTSLRMRNRARRLLEHMFAVEAFECLETMVELWRKSLTSANCLEPSAFFNLLHVLDGSRPKYTIPAIFNSIYSRTNPSALEPDRKSTLTSSLSDVDLTVFLIEYCKTLEDDAMDEIWDDCMRFLKDLLSNPFPHRQVLPRLLEFASILGEKVDNTNFGEQWKMRRELGDLFIRLLIAVFTTRPIGFLESLVKSEEQDSSQVSRLLRSEDVVAILAGIAPKLPKILVEPDRIISAANTICSNVIGPTFKSKLFPECVTKNTLELLNHIAKLPQNQRLWKKDLGEAFNDHKFFTSPITLVDSGWLPLLKQWSLNDKERMPEYLSRLVPPTTAGLFGVGATSTRNEADRKAQLNLRRITTLVLATTDDNFVKDLPLIQEKIVELLSATATSSPSSITRAEIYLLLRSLVLKISTTHLASFWPIVNAELRSAISSIIAPDHSPASDTYNNYSILQACKLLDTLLCIAPDDFQLHEWLFITDTIDAVYRPLEFNSVALIDQISEELELNPVSSSVPIDMDVLNPKNSLTRRPLLDMKGANDTIVWEKKDVLVGRVLRPFFSQLSIFFFEGIYSMCLPDREACRKGLLEDLFDDRSIVKAL